MNGPLAHFDALERALVRKGWPATSPWWRETLESFYATKRRQLVVRAGRRGGKSSTLARLAVLEGLFGEHQVPPGDLAIVGFVSVSRDEAASRLRTIRQILDVLGVKYKPIDGGIELEGRAVAFKVFAATVSAVVGGTWVCGLCDEVARWKDADTGANPATQVLASLRPTMATQPHARLFLSSSPLGTQDAHADAYSVGDTAWQQTAFAPTWVANPTISEDETHRLEPDQETWRREYAAVPIEGSELSIFAESVLRACTRKAPVTLEPTQGRAYTAAMDPGTRSNGWALAVAFEEDTADGGRMTRVALVREWRGSKSAPLDPDATLAEIAEVLLAYNLQEVWSDQFASDFVIAMAAQHDLTVNIEASTAQSKVRIYERLRQQFADGAVEIPDDKQLRADLLGVRKWVTRNGLSIELAKTPDGRHCDTASAVSLVCDKTSTSEALWSRASRQILRNEAANPYPREEDDGDRTSVLGSNFRVIKQKFDMKLCRACGQFKVGGFCPRHGALR